MNSFCHNLSAKRSQKGLSQKAMAEKLGVAQSSYSLYEKGAREPNIDKIIKIAEVLKISTDELFGIKFEEDTLLNIFKKLDDVDRAEITGTVKQMLKSEKYKEL